MQLAADKGRLDMLRWLLERDRQAAAAARSCGGGGDGPGGRSLLHQVVYAWPDRGPRDAAQLLEAVRLVHSHVSHPPCPVPYPDGPLVVNRAVARCDMELARCLHRELGCGFDGQVLVWAAKCGSEELVEWLVGAGCVKHGGAYLQAGYRGDKAMLETLRRAGVPWGEGMVGAGARCRWCGGCLRRGRR